MSADLVLRVAEPAGQPRATLYALHGGGLHGGYWDCASDPSLSLLQLGAALGFRVVAPDRPGYGANQERWPDGLAAADEAAVHVAAIRHHWGDEPVLLVGQSAGAIVSVHAAALSPWPGLIGVDYSGVGIQLNRQASEKLGPRVVFWGSEALYPPGTFESGGRPLASVVSFDGLSATAWAGTFPELAARVRVPVRITFVEGERWWDGGISILPTVAAAYTASPLVETGVQPNGGHNLSLGFAARPYHLRVVAFAEACLLRRRSD